MTVERSEAVQAMEAGIGPASTFSREEAMKTQRCLPAVLLALGWMLVQPAVVRAEDESNAGGAGGAAEKSKKRSNRGMWTFLWKAETVGEKIGEKLSDDQLKKVNTTRDEIRQKFKNEVESPDKQQA